VWLMLTGEQHGKLKSIRGRGSGNNLSKSSCIMYCSPVEWSLSTNRFWRFHLCR
jgi:hypothetical protein